MELVSVIIPTYNRALVIKETIQGVLKQTYPLIECIVVDDGSSDNTEQVLQSLDDSRLRYYKLDHNRGACYARNFGVTKAHGSLIAFQDSDDYWYPQKIESQVLFLKQHHADMVFCRIRSSGRWHRVYPTPFVREGKVSRNTILHHFLGSTQTFMLKKECLESVLFDERMPRFQDWDFLIRFSKDHTVFFQKRIFVNQNSAGESISGNPVSGLLACDRMLEKFGEDLNHMPKARANILTLKGTFQAMLNERAMNSFLEAARCYPFSAKTWIKLLFESVGLLARIYNYGNR